MLKRAYCDQTEGELHQIIKFGFEFQEKIYSLWIAFQWLNCTEFVLGTLKCDCECMLIAALL